MILQPELLLHPNIPKPLQGLNPRTIKGQVWWDEHRRKAYAKNDYHCWACGVHKSEAKYHQWLEGHEFYEYNYAEGSARLTEIVALCHCCHNFIHNGKTERDYQTRKISYDRFLSILQQGTKVLDRNNLPMNPFAYAVIKRNQLPITNIPRTVSNIKGFYGVEADWDDWGLEIDGQIYKSKFTSYEDWKNFYK